MKDQEAKGQLVYMAMEVAKTQGSAGQSDKEQGKKHVGGGHFVLRTSGPTSDRLTVTTALTHVIGSAVQRLTPTWRIIPGSCFESLALQVALDHGVPGHVLDRAQHLLQVLRQRKGTDSRA